MKCGLCGNSKLNAGVIVAIIAPVLIANSGTFKNNDEPDANEEVAQVDTAETQPTQDDKQEAKKVSTDVLGYKIEMIDGTVVDLEQYRGRVVMMVNVASECGLTPQYEGLEALYRKHKRDGLVILGFPANDFGAQEPGTNAEIAQFCSAKYDVTFPMAAKIHVKGKDVHPLYKQLTAQPEPIGGEPEWNFAKFIVDRKGEVVARFPSRTTPSDPALVSKISQLLEDDS